MENNNAPRKLVELANDARTARERTLAHLERLMRVAVTTVGTGAMLACRHLVVDPPPPPPPPPVDPPPPPPQECCENPDQFLIRGCIEANGVWAKVDGQWTLHLTLYARYGGPVSFDNFGKPDLTLSDIALKELETKPNQLTIVLVPVGDELPNLQLSVTCNRKKVPLKLSLDINEGPSEGRSVPVRLVK